MRVGRIHTETERVSPAVSSRWPVGPNGVYVPTPSKVWTRLGSIGAGSGAWPPAPAAPFPADAPEPAELVAPPDAVPAAVSERGDSWSAEQAPIESRPERPSQRVRRDAF